jgi:hypothetical protein
VGAVRLPYPIACIVLSVLLGPPVQFLSVLLDTRNLEKATAFALNTVFGTFQSTKVSTEQGLAQQTIFTLIIFAVLYMAHFMRSRLLAAEPALIPIVPAGEETFHKSFGGVSRVLPQLVMAIPLGLLSIPYLLNQSLFEVGPVFLSYLVLSNLILTLVFGTFVWVYLRSLWGLYQLGNEPLTLKPYHEDPMLGVRPIGSISLALFLAYNVVIGLSVLSILVAPPDPVGLAAITLLALLGGAMFILPLYSVHRKMAAEKANERTKVFEDFARLFDRPQEESASDDGSSSSSNSATDLLRGIRDTQILQLRREYISSIPTWPIDTGIIGRFAAIIISVFTVILARLVQIALHL